MLEISPKTKQYQGLISDISLSQPNKIQHTLVDSIEHYISQTSLKRVTDLEIFDQIILTDDCSNDGSSEIALNLASSSPIIEYINGTSNSGKGQALNNAKHLINTSHVVIHDADLEYFPDDIVEMFNLVEDNPESLILGSRFIGTS